MFRQQFRELVLIMGSIQMGDFKESVHHLTSIRETVLSD